MVATYMQVVAKAGFTVLTMNIITTELTACVSFWSNCQIKFLPIIISGYYYSAKLNRLYCMYYDSLILYTGKLALKYGVEIHVFTPYVSPVLLRSGSRW